MLVAQSCLTLCSPVDCSPPGFSGQSLVQGILQARILEWVAMPSSRGSSRPRDQTCFSYISCIGRQSLYHWHHLRSPSIRDGHPTCAHVYTCTQQICEGGVITVFISHTRKQKPLPWSPALNIRARSQTWVNLASKPGCFLLLTWRQNSGKWLMLTLVRLIYMTMVDYS